MAGSIGNGGMAVFPSSSGPDEQPRAYFADARNDQDHIYSFVPSEAYADVPRRYSDTIVLSSTDAATPPPLQQPSPSMYAYLASPIIGNLQSPAVHSRASFSSAPHQPMASISESASASAPDTDSSATPIPLFPEHCTTHRVLSAGQEPPTLYVLPRARRSTFSARPTAIWPSCACQLCSDSQDVVHQRLCRTGDSVRWRQLLVPCSPRQSGGLRREQLEQRTPAFAAQAQLQ